MLCPGVLWAFMVSFSFVRVALNMGPQLPLRLKEGTMKVVTSGNIRREEKEGNETLSDSFICFCVVN